MAPHSGATDEDIGFLCQLLADQVTQGVFLCSSRIALTDAEASLQETFVVAQHELAIDLTHELKGNTYRNKNGGASKWE